MLRWRFRKVLVAAAWEQVGWGVSTLTPGGLPWLSRGDAAVVWDSEAGDKWMDSRGRGGVMGLDPWVRGFVGGGSDADQEKGAADYQVREPRQGVGVRLGWGRRRWTQILKSGTLNCRNEVTQDGKRTRVTPRADQFSRVWLFATPWTAARQASLSITNSWSLLKLMSMESVMTSNHLKGWYRIQNELEEKIHST